MLGLDLSPVAFMIMTQIIIFLLGWPLEWTEIIIIFVPIFLPLLHHFDVDPVFFGVLVALNLQTSFLSPPVAMAPLLSQGRRAAARVDEPDLRRGACRSSSWCYRRCSCSTCSRRSALWLPDYVYSHGSP